MFSKGFVLSVGLSLCSSILIYLYVKSKINNLENKVDSLIHIIQSHNQLSGGDSSTYMSGAGHNQQCNYEKIVVSDDDEESSGSEEEDDDDEESSEGEGDGVESNEKDNNTVLETETESEMETETSVLEDNTNKVIELTSTHVLNGNELSLNPTHEMLEQEDGLDEMDNLDESMDDEEDDDDENEHEQSKVDYSKMGKVELRQLCEIKGFNTKGKKKHELLELLEQ